MQLQVGAGIGVSLATYAWLIRPTISNAQPWKVKTASALPGPRARVRAAGRELGAEDLGAALGEVTVTGSAPSVGRKRYSWKG